MFVSLLAVISGLLVLLFVGDGPYALPRHALIAAGRQSF